MTPDPASRATAMAAKAAIGDLGGNWMTGPEEEAATAAAGLDGWQLYFLGRHGVLGDVDPDVVTAAAFFFPADVVRSEWLAARQAMTPTAALERYLALCHDWGRARLSGFADVARLADLAQRVVDDADVAGLPLFAGWRALPVPADPPVQSISTLAFRGALGAPLCSMSQPVICRLRTLPARLTMPPAALKQTWQPVTLT